MQLGPWRARIAVKSQGAAPAQTKFWRGPDLKGARNRRGSPLPAKGSAPGGLEGAVEPCCWVNRGTCHGWSALTEVQESLSTLEAQLFSRQKPQGLLYRYYLNIRIMPIILSEALTVGIASIAVSLTSSA